MFKLKKIICLVVLLSSIVPMSTVHASFRGFQNFKSVVYKNPIAKNQDEAYQKFLKIYHEFKNKTHFKFDKEAGKLFRRKMRAKGKATLESFREAILEKIKKHGAFSGGSKEISALISKFLTDVKIENYLLHIRETNLQGGHKSKHVANLIRLNNNWFVIDATFELQSTKEDSFHFLNMPLVEYTNYLVHESHFSAPCIGVQTVNSGDIINARSSISLQKFLSIQN